MRKMRIILIGIAVICCAGLCFDPTDGVRLEDFKVDLVLDGHEEGSMETIADTEKRFKKLINAGFKFALPYLMSTATEIKISGKCMTSLLMLMKGVMDIKDWAVRMVDAIGKPSAGLLEGTATAMGDYDECLEIVVPRRMRPAPVPPYKPSQIAFTGQYCVVQIELPAAILKDARSYQAGNRSNSELANSKTFLKNLVKIAPRADIAELRLGVCIPSVCTNKDLQTIIKEVADMVKFNTNVLRCERKQPVSVTVEQGLILSSIGILILVVMVGTALEVYLRFSYNEQVHDVILENKNIIVKSFLIFSFARNTRRLFSLVPSNAPMISSVRGLKVLCACLYIVAWTYFSPSDYHFFKYRDPFNLYQFMEQWWFTIFANASAGADTLFLIAGLQVSYRLWWKSRRINTRISIPKFILKWYIRLTLSQVIVIGMLMCLPLFGFGPIWGDVVGPAIENCKQNWWMNMLAINNFFSSDKTCLPHTWLICCIMHMLILAPIVLLILSKSASIGIFVNLILILGCSTAIAMVTLMNELPPAPAVYFLSFLNLRTIWEKLFIQAYDHIGAFCIGILLGFLFIRFKAITLRKRTILFGWCAAIICNMVVICGLYGYRHGETMDMTLSAIYASLHRIGWSLGTAWIIFACAYGYGGFINTFLSWKLFIPLERLANLIYLLHPIVLFLHEGQLRERMYMAHLDQAMYATACIVFTIVLAIFCYVICVSPFLQFEKSAFYYNQSDVIGGNITENNHMHKGIKGDISSNLDIGKENFEHFRSNGRKQETEGKIFKT